MSTQMRRLVSKEVKALWDELLFYIGEGGRLEQMYIEKGKKYIIEIEKIDNLGEGIGFYRINGYVRTFFQGGVSVVMKSDIFDI
jgi:hypothetical protein